MLDRIEDALNTVCPHLRVDGGDVEFVELTDDMHVKIRWKRHARILHHVRYDFAGRYPGNHPQ